MKLHPATFRCPMECKIKGFDLNRNKFCSECDHKKINDDFRRNTENEWNRKLGKHNFKFDKFHDLLLSVISYEDVPPEKLSVRSSYLLSAYLAEKIFKEREALWERDQENK